MVDQTPPAPGNGHHKCVVRKARASEGNQRKGVVIEDAVLSARAFVREFLRPHILNDDETDLPALVDLTVDHIMQQDPAMIRHLLCDMARGYVYEQGRLLIQDTRKPNAIFVSPAGAILTEMGLRKRVEFLRKKWYQIKENVALHRYVFLCDMTREDLLSAADLRHRQAETDVVYELLWRELASGLEPGQRVSERYTPEEIEAKYQEIKARRNQ